MSKSLKRVKAQADALGLSIDVIEMTVSTKTAQQAADAIGSGVDQIAKSIIFRGAQSGKPVLFLTAGSNRVDAPKAAEIAGEPLERADAAFIRDKTGFAIGSVSPLGHLSPVTTFLDPRLQEFDVIWAAAGTPHHMFQIAPDVLIQATAAIAGDFTE